MLINVTETDIKNGVTRSTNSCPIALAFKRKFNEKVFVSNGTVSFYIKETNYFYNAYGDYIDIMLPQDACDFITKFDRSKSDVEPFKFWLPIN